MRPVALHPRLPLLGSASSGQSSFIYSLLYVHLFIVILLMRAKYRTRLLRRCRENAGITFPLTHLFRHGDCHPFGNIHYVAHLCIRLRTQPSLSYLILITAYKVNASRISIRVQAHQILSQGHRMIMGPSLLAIEAAP